MKKFDLNFFTKWRLVKEAQKEEKASDLDARIMAAQRSTRTLFRYFIPINDKLRLKFNWYYRWHENPESDFVHWAILVSYILALRFHGNGVPPFPRGGTRIFTHPPVALRRSRAADVIGTKTYGFHPF
jgi:hypothetical protein